MLCVGAIEFAPLLDDFRNAEWRTFNPNIAASGALERPLTLLRSAILLGRGSRRWLRKSQQPVSRGDRIAIGHDRDDLGTRSCRFLSCCLFFYREINNRVRPFLPLRSIAPLLGYRCCSLSLVAQWRIQRLPTRCWMMSANNMQALFACSRCFSRHPFEDLSPGQQLCKVRKQTTALLSADVSRIPPDSCVVFIAYLPRDNSIWSKRYRRDFSIADNVAKLKKILRCEI